MSEELPMPDSFDLRYDVVVVGTGGAAFGTALGAADAGLSVLMLESTDKWGGSTAMSGGGMWLPDNPLMQRAGVGDSREEALAYLEECVGEVSRSTSRAHKEAFVDGVEDFVLTAEKHGMVFTRAADYPDYYPELAGGKIGRAIEAKPFDARNSGGCTTPCACSCRSRSRPMTSGCSAAPGPRPAASPAAPSSCSGRSAAWSGDNANWGSAQGSRLRSVTPCS
jgi:succinate dehydrogenase/fumarate reductase flavoprotein subunit